MLPASLAQIGAISILSWIVTALGSMCIAYTFAKLGAYCKRAGGMSAYSAEAHGPPPFYRILYLLYLHGHQLCRHRRFRSRLSRPFFPWVKSSPMHTFATVVAILVLTMVANFKGPRVTGRISSITVWGIIIPVAGLSVIGWFWFKPELYMAAWNPHGAATGSAISSGIR